MARSVRDAAHVLTAIVGADPEDDITAVAEKHAVDYTSFLDQDGLRGKRIGLVRNYAGFDARVDDLLAVAVALMRDRGAEVEDVEFDPGREIGEATFTVLLCELKSDLALYFEGLGSDAPVKTLADVIAFNEANQEREMPYFAQEIFLQAEATGGVEDPEYAEALEKCKRLAGKEGIDKVMDTNRFDALIAPTGGPAWVTDLINGDHFGGGSSSPAAIAGYPNITLPMGYVHGMPVGLSFFGGAFSEPKLLAMVYGYEQASGHRRAPEFRPTAIVDA